LVRHHELLHEGGVLIQSTAEDGAARAAGLQPGDVIVDFDGVLVGSVDDLHRLLTEERVGVGSATTILRRMDKRSVLVTPREAQPKR
jgi:S1-C subfamily serine protease